MLRHAQIPERAARRPRGPRRRVRAEPRARARPRAPLLDRLPVPGLEPAPRVGAARARARRLRPYRRDARCSGSRRRSSLWLLFLPNAPYIVTDFVHLSAGSHAPLWFDGVELSAFAWTGMLLGFVSLYLIHAVIRHRFGAIAGWGACFACSHSSSVGVYLGRVKRWNSWDVLTQPGASSRSCRRTSATRRRWRRPSGSWSSSPACSPPPTASSTC